MVVAAAAEAEAEGVGRLAVDSEAAAEGVDDREGRGPIAAGNGWTCAEEEAGRTGGGERGPGMLALATRLLGTTLLVDEAARLELGVVVER